MKSIKKKAQEWADMYPSCGMADKSFQAGANYVLDEIEPIIKADIGSYKFQLDKIKQIIEQLKSNQ